MDVISIGNHGGFHKNSIFQRVNPVNPEIWWKKKLKPLWLWVGADPPFWSPLKRWVNCHLVQRLGLKCWPCGC
jgi:hypothetical protein